MNAHSNQRWTEWKIKVTTKKNAILQRMSHFRAYFFLQSLRLYLVHGKCKQCVCMHGVRRNAHLKEHVKLTYEKNSVCGEKSMLCRQRERWCLQEEEKLTDLKVSAREFDTQIYITHHTTPHIISKLQLHLRW